MQRQGGNLITLASCQLISVRNRAGAFPALCEVLVWSQKQVSCDQTSCRYWGPFSLQILCKEADKYETPKHSYFLFFAKEHPKSSCLLHLSSVVPTTCPACLLGLSWHSWNIPCLATSFQDSGATPPAFQDRQKLGGSPEGTDPVCGASFQRGGCSAQGLLGSCWRCLNFPNDRADG